MIISILTKLVGAHAGVVIGRALPYILGALLMAGAYLYIRWDAYNDGVAETTIKYETLILEERERIRKAGEEALAEARSQIKQLEERLSARNEEIEEIKRQGREDPHADLPAFGVDSVRRLNRIR